MRKKVLVVYYSQTGQLTSIVHSLCRTLAADHIDISYEALRPMKAYPFPWPLWKFLDVFPECVYLDAPPLQPLQVDPSTDFDLIIIAYTVWFLSPSLPISAFLQSDAGRRLLRGKPVITLSASRNMWLTAQTKVVNLLTAAQARLLDNIALVDSAPSLVTFITTPRWLLTGKRESTGGWLPAAGIAAADISAAGRFGHAIAAALLAATGPLHGPLLQGLGAVKVNPDLIASERIGHRSFLLWGRLLRAAGPAGSGRRKPLLLVYLVFLVLMIVSVVPVNMLLRKLLSPFTASRVRRLQTHYEQPSGSATFRMQERP